MCCTGTNYPVSSGPGSPAVTNNDFGGATYSAFASKNKLLPGAQALDFITSTGTYNGASVTLTRDNVYVYQSPMTIVVRPGDSLQPAGYDTYVDSGSPTSNFGGKTVLKLATASTSYQALLKFNLAAFPPGSPSFPPGSRAIPWYGVDPPGTLAKLQ